MGLAAAWFVPGAIALLGVLVGVLGSVGWARRQAKARRRIPKDWPLDPRVIANSQERQVWNYLLRTFRGQHVMVKLPITRFTLPRSGENRAHWYQMLSGVYCTFTVCGPDGRVIGCVDVPGPGGISRSNRLLKLSLLSQCGICYRIVRPDELPQAADILEEFLGDELALARVGDGIDAAALAKARQKLRAAVDRQRQQRTGTSTSPPSEFPSQPAASGPFVDSGSTSGPWQQPDSFIAPLDSRLAALA